VVDGAGVGTAAAGATVAGRVAIVEISPTTAPSPLNVVGEHIAVLASGAQTGSYEIFRKAGGEGSGPSPHCHP
jgi:hypothetical protein